MSSAAEKARERADLAVEAANESLLQGDLAAAVLSSELALRAELRALALDLEACAGNALRGNG